MLLASLSAGFTTLASAQIVTSNLLGNPGAETGNLNSWSIVVGAPFADNGTFDAGINPRTGGFDFTGGSANPLGQLSQTIDLIGTGQVTALQLDSGTTTADASFWEQGLNQGAPSDEGAIKLTFLDASSAFISSVSSAFVDSHMGSWSNGGVSSIAVPIGTRYITYTMLFQRNQGSDNDSFIDDNVLTLTIVPEPGSIALLLAGLPLLALAARRSRTPHPRA